MPGWDGFKGREMAERDWLYRVLAQAYDNSNYGISIDEKQFDVDGAYESYHAALANELALPAGPSGDAPQVATSGAPLINVVPMKKDLEFALTAFRNFFDKYVEGQE